MRTKAYIKYLEQLQKETNLRFKRVGNTLTVSWPGHNCVELAAVESILFEMGLRYSQDREQQEWVPACGMTFSYFIEPEI